MTESFYARVLRRAEKAGVLNRDSRVLVVAGGPYDHETFLSRGYTDVTISNVDAYGSFGTEFPPYGWSVQHAERLTFPNKSFDVTVVHAGLHHCRSPHAALAEMYRVACRGIVVIEARDSLTMRLAAKVGLTTNYEIEAVVDEGYSTGGVENSAVPNFVYRWTEREIDKTVRSLEPMAQPDVQYLYGLRLPTERLSMRKSQVARRVSQALSVVARAGQAIFPRQGNCFGFIVRRPDEAADYFPWINAERTGLDREWAEARFQHKAER